MKAAIFHQFGPPEVLRYEDVPDPVAGPGEVVVAVHAVNVNRALDCLVRAGDPSQARRKVEPPHVLGGQGVDFSMLVDCWQDLRGSNPPGGLRGRRQHQ